MNFSKKLLICGFIIFSSYLNLARASDHTNPKHTYKVTNINTSNVLNVRQQPDTNASVILQLPADAKWIIERTSETKGNWQKIVWGVKEGWVYRRYISTDPKTSQLLEKHRQCIKQNPQNSICCGLDTQQKKHNRNTKVQTFMVVNVPTGQSLNVRASGNAHAKKVATIPHNASGIVKFPGQKVGHGRSTWQKIRWNGRDGWVNSSFLKYDPIISDYRNIVLETCAVI